MKPTENIGIHAPTPETIPIIPTLDIVVFPQMIVPLMVLDEKIIAGIRQSLNEAKPVLLLASKKQADDADTVGARDLYLVGTIANIMRIIEVPEGGLKVLVQGIHKAQVAEIITEKGGLYARVTRIPTAEAKGDLVTAQIQNLKLLVEKLSGETGSLNPDFHIILSNMSNPEKITDFILSHLNIGVEQAQALLEASDYATLLTLLTSYLTKEVEISEIQEKIRNNARESMNKAQKEFYLREQIRAIKKELHEDESEELDIMRKKLAQLRLPEEAAAETKRQINRLERTASDSMEAAVIRNHLEWIFALPWNIETEDNLDIAHAKTVLDQDHHGLKDVKDRILDFISIRNLKKDVLSPILCLIGPPGTGKTSLGQSIAKSLGRSYARISLGGVRDEAEIRGHRRTYVGAMPGRFIQALRKAGSCNPLMIIDELDKIGSDFRGDPSAAMLEVLDPQQNRSFYDNYLGISFDLSKVMFVATANTLDTISVPLRDRMEIIELSGYTVEEKFHIARNYLIPRSLRESGLEPYKVDISDAVINDVILNYTKESGIRHCERLIRKLCSKAARSLVEKKSFEPFSVENIELFLGPRKFIEEAHCPRDHVGIANGLAWTVYGGELLKIEAVLMPGRGKLLLTGHLGTIMKESAQAAMSYARAHARKFSIPARIFTHHDLHIHAPAGAVPKDGPSAGIAMLTSILSALTQRPINAQYAMTGELNLRGGVMAIGGVKEKILAAKRNHVPHVIIPLKNKSDLVGLDDLLKDVHVIFVQHVDEVMEHVLLKK